MAGVPGNTPGGEAADAEAQARLRAELDRISGKEPHIVLEIPQGAPSEVVRGAFLRLTKELHPTRYARFGPETVRLANEVFLAVKRAHEILGGDRRGGRPAISEEVRIPTHRKTPAAGVPAAVPRTATIDPRPSSSPRPAPDEASASNRIPTPRAPSLSPTRMPALRANTPSPPVAMTPPTQAPPAGGDATRRPTPTAGPASPGRIPTAAASPVTRRAPTPSARAAAPSAPPAPAPTTPTAVAAAAATPGPAAIPRIATTGYAPGPPPPRIPTGSMPAVVEDAEAAWEKALGLLRRRLWGEARAAFHQLAVARPTEKKFRAHMHYARGREHQDDGRHDEARAEWERALNLMPELNAARAAIDQLPEPPKPPGGLLSKLFRKG